MATWLITGASGLLGANFAISAPAGVRLVGLSRSPAPAGLFDDELRVDLTDATALRAEVLRVQPDVIVHAGALASHPECEENPALAYAINATASGELAAAAADCGSAFAYISTDAVFDGTRGHYAETDATHPFSVYSASKLAGEDEVLDANPDSLIVRTNFFGWSPSGRRSILEFFYHSLSEHRKVNGFTDFVVTSLYVRDLAEILGRLVQQGRQGRVHVTSRDSLSKYDFGQAVADQFGLDGALISPTSAAVGHSMASARDLSLDTTLLAGWLGHEPPSQREGLRRAFDDLELRRVIRNSSDD